MHRAGAERQLDERRTSALAPPSGDTDVHAELTVSKTGLSINSRGSGGNIVTCMSVCLSVSHSSKTTQPNLTILRVHVSGCDSASDGVTIRYVLPVL